MLELTDVFYPYSYSQQRESPGFLANKVADIRRLIAPFRFDLAAKGIVDELDISSKSTVLELGCGLGLLGNAIKKRVGPDLKYIGFDLVYNSAKESKDKVSLSVQTDITRLPLPSESYDSVVATDTLEHVPNVEMAISEIARVLRPGGKGFIVIADPSEGRFNYVHDHINRNNEKSNVTYWESLFNNRGLKVLPDSEKYRGKDWRKIFNLPILTKLKNKPGFACAFNPINRPGVYIVQK